MVAMWVFGQQQGRWENRRGERLILPGFEDGRTGTPVDSAPVSGQVFGYLRCGEKMEEMVPVRRLFFALRRPTNRIEIGFGLY